MKKLLCALLAVLIPFLSVPAVHAEEVGISAQAYVLYCPDNGEILLSDNADTALPIASTTKIMTTLLTLEEAERENRTVEFTDEMIAEGSSMYLKRGEKVTLYDLAVGMMMQSGNDAANAAAIAIAGSIEDFAVLMNQKAQAIGMEHTHFVTPSGLDDEDHYSTAHDMALLMAVALQNDDFAAITAQTSMEVHFIYPADKFITYPNHNKLLQLYDGCIGGKTGYTDQAGRTLATAARRNGLTLIAVTLNDRDDWDDHCALYDYGFDHYEARTVSCNIDERALVGGYRDTISLSIASACVIVPKDAGEIRQEILLPAFVYAPVKEGETVGKILCSHNGKMLSEIPLKAAESAAYNNDKRSVFTYIKDKINWHS